MAKFIPFNERCKEKVRTQFVYTGVRRYGLSYAGCERRAGPSGYCSPSPTATCDLLPCPFCGERPMSMWVGNNVPGMEDCGYWAVECRNCGRGSPCRFVGVHADNQTSAEEAWNAPLRSRSLPSAERCSKCGEPFPHTLSQCIASSTGATAEDLAEELSKYSHSDLCEVCSGAGCVGIPGAQCRFCDGAGKNRLALAFKWLALEKRVKNAEEIAERQMNDAEQARIELAVLKQRSATKEST